jgi:hypothetical protein
VLDTSRQPVGQRDRRRHEEHVLEHFAAIAFACRQPGDRRCGAERHAVKPHVRRIVGGAAVAPHQLAP